MSMEIKGHAMIRYCLILFMLCIYGDIYGVRYSMRKKQNQLHIYHQKRNTRKSGEPYGREIKKSKPIFVVQKHDASHLHYDFRLAIDGVLKSWAVPKGPPRRAGIKRLAIETEDHPLAYATFEGTIPEGNYGAGTVTIWDHGTYDNNKTDSVATCMRNGSLEFTMHGSKLKGTYALVRMQGKTGNWLFMKKTARTTQ